ncbi:MAG: rRNA maturation RNase YbeY [Rhodocyclaceae bacterium]|jgi:probable rRNA maturation factor|nr:rRNA maturation RNase YbeY [Rhodocyclaceae bacterium]
MNANRPELHLAVQYAVAGEEVPDRAQVRRWARAAQEMPVTVTVRFVDTAEGRRLNRAFRGKDYATNVLSFVYEDEPVIGDLVICLPVVRREAKEQGKPFRAHLAHMVVHGMLHLQGYDHETNERDALRMEARERAILARFRIPDPYR